MNEFKSRLNEILKILERPQNESKIKRDLTLAFLANYLCIILDNSNSRVVIDYLASQKFETPDDLQKGVDEAVRINKDKLKKVDLGKALVDASHETLFAYAKELEKILTKEKSSQIFKIVEAFTYGKFDFL